MPEARETGHDTPEGAACGDIPRALAAVVGVRVLGDTATVWLLANDRPPFEAYEAHCSRRGGRWFYDEGFGGFNVGTPDEVLAEARRLGWS